MSPNPFSPGVFYSDQSLFGREKQFELVDGVIEQIENGYPCSPIFFIGPSGLGKTSILKRVANDLRKRHWLCGYSEAGSDIGSAIYDVLADAQQIAPSKSAVRRMLSRIAGFNAGAGTLSLGIDIASIENGSAYTRLVERFQTISDASKFGQVGAAFLIDEAQGLPADHLEVLLRALGAVEDSPIVLFLAALPSLMDSMALRARSMAHSDVSILTPLDRASAKTALIEPAGLAGGRFGQKALRSLINFACGHPLTLQMLGRSSWDLAVIGIPDNQMVDILEEHANKAVAQVKEQLKRGYYGPIWRGCTHEERLILRAVAQAGGIVAERDLIRTTRKGIKYPEDILYNLDGKGVLYVDKDAVTFVLPGFIEFAAVS